MCPLDPVWQKKPLSLATEVLSVGITAQETKLSSRSSQTCNDPSDLCNLCHMDEKSDGYYDSSITVSITLYMLRIITPDLLKQQSSSGLVTANAAYLSPDYFSILLEILQCSTCSYLTYPRSSPEHRDTAQLSPCWCC